MALYANTDPGFLAQMEAVYNSPGIGAMTNDGSAPGKWASGPSVEAPTNTQGGPTGPAPV